MAIIGFQWNQQDDTVNWLKTSPQPFLLRLDGQYYGIVSGGIGPLDIQEPLLLEYFENYGITNLRGCPDFLSTLNLTNVLEIVCFTKSQQTPSLEISFDTSQIHNSLGMKVLMSSDLGVKKLSAQVTPKTPVVIVANDDISLDLVSKINSLILTSSENQGVVRVASSADKGETWFGANGSVDIGDIQDFIENGMTIAEFSSFDFDSKITEEKVLRNAYLLHKNAEIDRLESDMSYLGDLVKILSDHVVEVRVKNAEIRLHYKEDGNFIFNILS